MSAGATKVEPALLGLRQFRVERNVHGDFITQDTAPRPNFTSPLPGRLRRFSPSPLRLRLRLRPTEPKKI